MLTAMAMAMERVVINGTEIAICFTGLIAMRHFFNDA
jgi:hypothetical protein